MIIIAYLNGFSNSQDLFNSLKFSADDFSWYIPDVQAQLDAFKGTTVSYGIELPRTVVRRINRVVMILSFLLLMSFLVHQQITPVLNEVILIYKIDGTVLNTSNISLINRIFTESSVSVGVANFRWR